MFAIYPSLENASVIVTGGASGIGMDIVRAFAGQKARVGFLDFDVEHGEALAAELQGAGAQVRFEACDLRDIDALRRAVEITEQQGAKNEHDDRAEPRRAERRLLDAGDAG